MLEAYRRQVADYLETQRNMLDDAGRLLVSDQRFRTMDVYQRDVAVYVYHLFATMAAMAGGLLSGLLLARIIARRLSAQGELAPHFLRRARPGETCGGKDTT